jgi:hypothetical protein
VQRGRAATRLLSPTCCGTRSASPVEGARPFAASIPAELEWLTVPAEIARGTFPHQKDSVASLLRRFFAKGASRGGFLGDEPSMGKTLQAVAAVATLVHSGDARRVLIVAPANLVGHWKVQMRQWTVGLTVRCDRGGTRARRRVYEPTRGSKSEL